MGPRWSPEGLAGLFAPGLNKLMLGGIAAATQREGWPIGACGVTPHQVGFFEEDTGCTLSPCRKASIAVAILAQSLWSSISLNDRMTSSTFPLLPPPPIALSKSRKA